MNAIQIENKGNSAIRRLRMEKLQSGHPFMINSNELPSNEAYLEFPDGSITLVSIEKNSRDFVVIRHLTSSEKTILRSKFNLTNLGS